MIRWLIPVLLLFFESVAIDCNETPTENSDLAEFTKAELADFLPFYKLGQDYDGLSGNETTF